MLRIAVGVDGGLAAADELPPMCFDQLGLVEPNRTDQDQGLTGVRFMPSPR
jgi:hypothetical protein